MAGDGSDPAPYPMPGRTEFSADEEKQMRAGGSGSTLLGTRSSIRINKATGEVTQGEPEPMMGHSIPKSEF